MLYLCPKHLKLIVLLGGALTKSSESSSLMQGWINIIKQWIDLLEGR